MVCNVLDQIDMIHKEGVCFYILVASLVGILSLQAVELVKMVDGIAYGASSSTLVEAGRVALDALVFALLPG